MRIERKVAIRMGEVSTAPATGTHGRRAAALALVGFWLAAFGPMLFADVYPYYRDQLLTNWGLTDYLHRRLVFGQLPAWYPYQGLGVPFIGQMITGTFHPQTLLLLPLRPLLAQKLDTLLAYLVGAFGAYRAARALGANRVGATTGGVAFMLGGYALGVSHASNYLVAHCTLPWTFWAALRSAEVGKPRHFAMLGLTWALVLLAGVDAQTAGFVAILGLAALLIHGVRPWRVLGMLASAGLGVLLAAVELVPALTMSHGGARQLGAGDAALGRMLALHPLRLLELGLPGLIPDALRVEAGSALLGQTSFWATTLFAGASVLLMAAAGAWANARKGPVLVALVVLALWLAMAEHGGLLPVLWRVVPALAHLRFPEKLAGHAWLGLSGLAALGVTAAAERSARMGVFALAFAGVCATLALTLGPLEIPEHVLAWRHASPSLQVIPALHASWSHGLWVVTSATLALGGVLLALRKSQRLVLLLPVVVFAELASQNLAYLPMAPGSLLEGPVPFGQLIRSLTPPNELPRVISEAGGHAPRSMSGSELEWAEAFRRMLRSAQSGLYGIDSLNFNFPLVSERAAWLFVNDPSRLERLGPLYGFCFRITDLRVPVPASDQVLAEDPTHALRLTHVACAPRVYLAAAHSVPDRAGAMAHLPQELPLTQVVWEGGPELEHGKGTVTLEESTPEHLTFSASADEDAALVLNDEWAQGWTATLDGRPVPVYVTNGVVRGVRVPKGAHVVEMRYRVPGLRLGIALSLLGLLATLVLLFTRIWPGKGPHWGSATSP
jgi:hypothetical protein